MHNVINHIFVCTYTSLLNNTLTFAQLFYFLRNTNNYSAHSKRHKFVIGLNIAEFLVRTLHLRTCPSLLLITSVTLPSGHCPLGTLYSTTSTMSSTCTSLVSLRHFFRACRVAKYSFNYLFQNISAKYWICLNHLLL